MLPISDDNRGRKIQPVVTWALIAINIVIFTYQWLLSEQEHWRFLIDWAAIPEQISAGQNLHTLVTSAFLHGSWFHLGSNMLFLWIFGDNVEDVMGHVKYLVFYLLTAIGAVYAQVFVDPGSSVPMVGASGAVSGLLAAYIVMFPHGRIRTLVIFGIFITAMMVPAWIMIGYWILLQVISGIGTLSTIDEQTGGVAFFAHIGGFIAGLLLVGIFRNKKRQDAQNWARQGRVEERRWGMR